MGRMAELKTKRNKASVAAFVAAIEDEGRRRDCKKLVALMKKVTDVLEELVRRSVKNMRALDATA